VKQQLERTADIQSMPFRRAGEEGAAADRLVRVLVVKKDSYDLRGAVENAEKNLGLSFQWSCVTSLDALPDHLNTNAFDVILLDLEPAGEEGLEALSRASFIAPVLPIIALADAEQRKRATPALRQGADDVLDKDRLDGELVARTLHHVCERRRLQDALGSMPRDFRTGLYNRHFFLLMAEQYLNLAGRLRGLVLMSAALEGLRLWNPPPSPLEERRLLIQTGRILAKSFRASDLIAHWSRCEFVALALDCDASSIPIFQERLAGNLQEFNENEAHPPILLSTGYVAVKPDEETSLPKLITAADAARDEQWLRQRPA
jgi:PleD family two-component response regulator